MSPLSVQIGSRTVTKNTLIRSHRLVATQDQLAHSTNKCTDPSGKVPST